MRFGLRRPGIRAVAHELQCATSGMFSTDPMESAAEAGLRYVSGRGPCIRRVRSGRAFRYLRPDGKPLRDAKTPPAHSCAGDSSRLDRRLDLPHP